VAGRSLLGLLLLPTGDQRFDLFDLDTQLLGDLIRRLAMQPQIARPFDLLPGQARGLGRALAFLVLASTTASGATLALALAALTRLATAGLLLAVARARLALVLIRAGSLARRSLTRPIVGGIVRHQHDSQ